MNYKLEKFWKAKILIEIFLFFKWTINLKSFEKAFQKVANPLLQDEL